MTALNRLMRAGAVLLGLTTICAMPANAAELRLASYLPQEHFATKLVLNPLIAKIDEYTGGSVSLKLFPGGQLANASGTLNSVKSGIANMGLVGIGYVGDVMPLSTIIELPGAFADLEKGQAAYTALIEEKLVKAEFLPNRVRPLMVSILPQMQLVLAKDIEITKLADLAGLKIRVPHSTAGDAISALGMVPVEMPVTDLYLALERGTVDGAVNLTASVPAYKLNEVTSLVTKDLALGSIAFVIVIAEKDWAKLSAEQQEQVARAARESSVATVDTLIKVNAASEKKLAEIGMKVVSVPESVKAEIAAALAKIEQAWIETVSERTPQAIEVADRYKALLADQ